MSSDAEKDHWLADALGFDVAAQSGAAAKGGLGDEVDAPASAQTAEPAPTAAPQPAAASGETNVAPEAAAPTSAAAAPPPPPKPKPITLKSQTKVNAPANRTRTKLGVGEQVTLTVTPGPGTWTTSAGTLNARSGSTVTLTAPTSPGTVDIAVEAGGQTAKMKFTVIAPSSVHQEVTSTEHLNNHLPNAGFHAQIYLGPDDVSFAEVTFTEDEVGAKAVGSWTAKNGEGHSPNPSPIGCSSVVIAGKGTKTLAVDHCWSGYVPGLTLTDWTGEMSWTIPWNWQCGSSHGAIARVVQRVVTTKDGATTISKAGARFTANLS